MSEMKKGQISSKYVFILTFTNLKRNINVTN